MTDKELGKGGEPRQQTTDREKTMTTAQGGPIADDQNSLKAGPRGPVLMEDHVFREKMFHFDHERIPERVVHARGYGVHGHFELKEAIPELSCADIFQRVGEKTPTFTRFSTVAGNKGSFDLARDVRGFATKFYTQEGNWDLVGNNIPVFFIQDAIKFPDLIHSVKPAPDRGFPQAQSAHDNFWDFVSLSPEAIHMTLWQMSDRAIPRSFRFMEGFGVHTFRLVNAEGKSHYVKFHWKPKQGLQSVVWNEALKINGADPDFHRRDMWDAIDAGDYPQWDLGIQVFDDEFADNFEFDILDATKIIPEEQVPVRIIGTLTLDANVDNFFAETEQVAFCTQNIVRGIDHTNDPLLQGRNFSYLDTQLKRLGGPNFTHIPINAPKCPFHHFQQDGHMAMHNPKGRVNYEPNSWGEDGGPRENPEIGFKSYPEEVEGTKQRVRSETFADHYSQARQFYISQTEIEQQHIATAYTFELSKCQEERIRLRMLSHLMNVHDDLAKQVAEGLGVTEMPEPAKPAREPITDLPPSDALSILKNAPNSFAGRKLGLFLTEGADASVVEALEKAFADEGAMVAIVTPHIQGVTLSDGSIREADEKIDGGPSVVFDAVALVFGNEKADKIAKNKPAQDFVSDAFAHNKFIAWTTAADPLLNAAGIEKDEGTMEVSANNADAFLQTCRKLRFWQREEKLNWE
ncbi:catalase [Sulfitobacter sp. KE34]|uniref:Catalase n=1 Tax=Sulfitobacter faviae TaxID=1775881 RepID=A0AAX3LU17_9RHOB|nr:MULTISPECIES: catalase [Sulfitobacter]MDF3351147.1 catalase [Sulfitobacter sp. KE12]MDF3354819.1 catalase [Sulfitobacter sp. KE27]MDF3358467.1 catalase [Sulfitobacter sp. KE33]MDF3362283.1 catalase [Sulfitobacter sp. Ks41]MDF3365891.1 catalase [Sulfitobacter sp. Ks34]